MSKYNKYEKVKDTIPERLFNHFLKPLLSGNPLKPTFNPFWSRFGFRGVSLYMY